MRPLQKINVGFAKDSRKYVFIREGMQIKELRTTAMPYITLHNRILCTLPARCLVAGVVLASLSFLHGPHRNQWREQLRFKDSQDMSYGSYDALWQWHILDRQTHRQRQNSPGCHLNLGQSRSTGTSSGPGLPGKALNFKDIAEVLIQVVRLSFVSFSSVVSCVSQQLCYLSRSSPVDPRFVEDVISRLPAKVATTMRWGDWATTFSLYNFGLESKGDLHTQTLNHILRLLSVSVTSCMYIIDHNCSDIVQYDI